MRPDNLQPSPRSIIRGIVEDQPEDASYEEIMRELAFDRMVERGLQDVLPRVGAVAGVGFGWGLGHELTER